MCVSCGCGRFEDSHGDERNITVGSRRRAADASNLTIDQVLGATAAACNQMLAAGVPDHQSSGQAVEERLHPD